MRVTKSDLHPSIYLLADHLDAALAAGEDLLALSMIVTELASRTSQRTVRNDETRLSQFLSRARTLEASLVAHVLQARRRALEVPRPDAHLKPLVQLFIGGTAALVDAATDYGHPDTLAFDQGADRMAYLRSRGLVAKDAGSLMPTTKLEIGDEFRLSARIELGALLDLVATFLEALDLRYGLYPDAEPVLPTHKTLPLPMPMPATETAPMTQVAEPAGAKAMSLAAALAELQRS